MHRFTCVSLAAVIFMTWPVAESVEAQSAQRTSAGAAAEQTLKQLEDSWAAALVKRDAATFRRLLATGFVYTENDRVMSRDDVLEDVVSGTDTTTAARNDALDVHVFGGTAVVTGWLIVNGRGPSGPFEHRYRFTDTWVERGNTWKIVSAQDYLAPVKKP